MATKIKFFKKRVLKDPVLIVGLPGIGLVGKLAADYMLSQLKAEKIAEIYSDSFPPSVQTVKGEIKLLCDEIHLIKAEKDLLFLVGPVQPSLDARLSAGIEHYEFAEAIIKNAKKLGVKKVFTLAGINIGEKRILKKSGIVVAATSKKVLMELKKYGLKKTEEMGFISGAAGLLLGIGKKYGMEGACIMGETNAKMVYGDQGAAKKVIETITKMFGLKIDMTSIEKESNQIEKAFRELTKQLTEKTKKTVTKKEDDLSYVR